MVERPHIGGLKKMPRWLGNHPLSKQLSHSLARYMIFNVFNLLKFVRLPGECFEVFV